MPKVEHLVYGDRKVFAVSAFNRGSGRISASCHPFGCHKGGKRDSIR